MDNKAPQIGWDYISPERKELYFRIINDVGMQDLHAIGLRLHYLHEFFPPEKMPMALKWLISNNFIGKKFIQFWSYQCGSSDLHMVKVLTSVCENAAIRAMFAGKDLRI